MQQHAAAASNDETNNRNFFALAFWFYNPITIAISSRGNSDSLIAFLVLIFIYFLKKENYALSGLFYGLSIHFKIYPITFSLALLFYFVIIHEFNNNNNSTTQENRRNFSIATITTKAAALFLNKNLLIFVSSSLSVLISLTYLFYLKYGYIFLYETYLYHLERQDTRHNFSPYFYMLYLIDRNQQFLAYKSILFKFVSFLPQLLLIIVCSFFFNQRQQQQKDSKATFMHKKGSNLEFCFFMITFLFVTFNKVCTSQYFVWYLSLIPLIVPRLNLKLKQVVFYSTLWILGQVSEVKEVKKKFIFYKCFILKN